MKRTPVLTYPEPTLRNIAEPIAEEAFGSAELASLAEKMTSVMRALKGIGLAATQIGVHRQLVVIELEDRPFVFANPVLSNPAKRQEVQEEGCLSVPNVFGLVNRSATLTLSGRDLKGKPFRLKADGLFARVIQHELDHLKGRLFIDRCHELTSGINEARRLKLTIPPLETP